MDASVLTSLVHQSKWAPTLWLSLCVILQTKRSGQAVEYGFATVLCFSCVNCCQFIADCHSLCSVFIANNALLTWPRYAVPTVRVYVQQYVLYACILKLVCFPRGANYFGHMVKLYHRIVPLIRWTFIHMSRQHIEQLTVASQSSFTGIIISSISIGLSVYTMSGETGLTVLWA